MPLHNFFDSIMIELKRGEGGGAVGVNKLGGPPCQCGGSPLKYFISGMSPPPANLDLCFRIVLV